MSKKLTLNEFVNNFFSKWPEKRDWYSFKDSVYLGKDDVIVVFCLKHNKYFKSTPDRLLQTGGAGCEICMAETKERVLKENKERSARKLLDFTTNAGYTFDLSSYQGEGVPIVFKNINNPNEILKGSPTWFKERYYKINNIKRDDPKTILIKLITENCPNIDVSKIVYKKYKDPVELICKNHPNISIWMSPDTIKRRISKGLNLCENCIKDAEIKERTSILVKEYNQKHPDHHYDFSNSLVISINDDFTCHCNKHDIDFSINACKFFHYDGICPVCAKERRAEKNRVKEEKRFFDYMKSEHPEIDISDARYETSTTPLLLHCNIHPDEDIWLSPWDVKFGIPRLDRGICPICSEIERNNKLKEDWIRKAEIAQNYRYDYSNIKYNGWDSQVEGIVCKSCGKVYSQPASSHLLGYCCCHDCHSITDSIMESYVTRWLNNNEIQYSREVFIPNSELLYNNKNKLGIRIDFVIENNDIIYWVETDGPQHNKYVPRYHPNGFIDYERQVIRDECEKLHCIDSNINLVRFSYLYDSYTKFEDALTRIILNNENIVDVLLPYPEPQDQELIINKFKFNK